MFRVFIRNADALVVITVSPSHPVYFHFLLRSAKSYKAIINICILKSLFVAKLFNIDYKEV